MSWPPTLPSSASRWREVRAQETPAQTKGTAGEEIGSPSAGTHGPNVTTCQMDDGADTSAIYRQMDDMEKKKWEVEGRLANLQLEDIAMGDWNVARGNQQAMGKDGAAPESPR